MPLIQTYSEKLHAQETVNVYKRIFIVCVNGRTDGSLNFTQKNVKTCQSQILMKRNTATHLYRHLPYMEINNAEKDIG